MNFDLLQLAFYGTIENDMDEDIAIDDVSLNEGHCNIIR